jgi:hypothetical protein
MAAVTITVNSKGVATARGRYKIWLNAGTSEYLPVLPLSEVVTTCGVRTISRKDHDLSLQAERGILRGHTPDLPFQEEDMVRPAWRRAERGRTEMTTPWLFGAE